jgi:taurine dioxygenase
MTQLTEVSVRPLTAAIGAEIRGVDLESPLDHATFERIHQALLDHLVLLFPNQHNLTPEGQVRFGERFGAVVPSVGTRVTDVVPGVSVLDQVRPTGQGNDTWHSDHMFLPDPPLGTMLRAVQLPAVGGDTCFASMYAAYDGLSPALQSFLDGLTATHSAARIATRVNGLGVYSNDVVKDLRPPVVHPLVRVHPETGRKALFACVNFTTRIVELTEEESDGLLSILFEHIKAPAFQFRVRWEPDTIAFWDNRAVQHCAVADYDERRLMHRTLISGDRPYGPPRREPS